MQTEIEKNTQPDIPLTILYELVHNNLCMRGYVRTREKCPQCDQSFQLVHDKFLVCPACLQIPNRVYVEICWKGKQFKIFSDTDGRPLRTWEHANRILSEIRQRIDKHRFEPTDYQSSRYHKLQFKNYAQRWLDYCQSMADMGECSHLTLKNKRSMVKNHFAPFFKDLDIRDIRTGDIEDFALQLPSGLSPLTRHHLMTQLKSMFNWAKRRRDIKYLPEFPRCKQAKRQITWAGPEIQDRIIEHIPKQHQPIFIFMMRQGCRPGEARALMWSDINWHDRTVTIRRTYSDNILKETTKTDQERVIPLDDGIYAMLKPKKALGFVFVTKKGEPYKTRTTLNYAWDKACKLAGIDHITLYQGTRHSFASQAINKGVDLYRVQRFLGHTSPKTTQKYAHLDTDGLRVALRGEKVKEISTKVRTKLGTTQNDA